MEPNYTTRPQITNIGRINCTGARIFAFRPLPPKSHMMYHIPILMIILVNMILGHRALLFQVTNLVGLE